MNRSQRRPYLQQVADAGLQQTKLGPQMAIWLCKLCRYLTIEHEYGEMGSVLYSYPDCSHPLPAVSDRFANESENQAPWYPQEDEPPRCNDCEHRAHPETCAGSTAVDLPLVSGFDLTFAFSNCSCLTRTPRLYNITADTVWDCFGFRPKQ